MKLSFLGAAGTVTGSKYLLEHDGRRVLVDCGLFQGFKNLRQQNWEDFPFDPAALDAVVLTHAHLDHSGALPRLVREGFRGPVFATQATYESCQLLLPDSARLQEEDAEYANRHGSSRHQPALPLYTEADAERTLRQFQPLPRHEDVAVAPGFVVRAQRSGHILGASSLRFAVGGKSVLFSGDLGRPDDPVMLPPEPPLASDHVVMESTYGDRLHDEGSVEAELGAVIRRAAERGGAVLLPAFAVGRAQTLLHLLARLKGKGRIPDLPVYLNSPMAIDMQALFLRHAGEHRLDAEQCRAMAEGVQAIRSTEQSKALTSRREPAIIVSASGMATGGRVLHHLRVMAPDPRNAIVFVGYQAGGTRGARLVNGERTVRIFGQDVPVNAEIASLRGLSAHADARQLLEWLRALPEPPQRVYLTHGEPGPADHLRERIDHELGWDACVPRHGQNFTL
jgi:metallo-beta-lactamase family protein